MSTAQTEKKKLFNEASASKLPKLVCTGYISGIGEGKVSGSGNYNVNPIEISGFGASRNQKVFLLTRPEWFAKDENGYATFRPDQLDKVEGGRSMLFVYQKNIRSRGGISLLEGVAGNAERFENLQEAFLSTEGIDDDNESAEVIEKVLADVLLAKEGEEPFEIGYVLKQQRTKTGEKDAEGHNVYILERTYEVDTWFEATPENKAKYVKSAEKSAEKAKANNGQITFKVCFDNSGLPF